MALMRTMKPNDKVTLISDRGERIVVTLTESGIHQSRLSIDAPRNFYIDFGPRNHTNYRREESLYQRGCNDENNKV
jgi:hypothetical protein